MSLYFAACDEVESEIFFCDLRTGVRALNSEYST